MLSEKIKLDTSWTEKSDRSTKNVARIAELIKHDVNFAKDESGALFYFEDGRYKPRGENLIAELYVDWLEECDSKEDWQAGRSKQICEYISTSAPNIIDRPSLNVINLQNGIYDWNNGKMFKHTPKYLSTIQIPIKYDPDATCPNWDRFLNDVLPYPGGANYLREVIGICMIPFTGLQKCIVLVGGGSNGKSTYLTAMQSAIGIENVCNIPLHTLTNSMERFARSGLVGKLVNIFGDMSSKKIEDAANFKPLVGEDRILIENKHRDAYYYTPFCKLIFSCNEVVKSDDDSEGYKRRFIHVPFTQRFKVDAKLGLELRSQLAKPSELSGLLNHILPRLPEIVQNGFTVTPEVASIIDEWCIVPESTKQFLQDTLVADPSAIVPIRRYYDWHVEHCPCIEAFERTKLIKYIRAIFPGIKANYVTKIGGISARCYHGVTVKDPALAAYLLRTVSADEELERQINSKIIDHKMQDEE